MGEERHRQGRDLWHAAFAARADERALRAASKMQIVENLTDAEIAEAHRSADVFAEVEE